MRVGTLEFDDTCPVNCKSMLQPLDQGSLCIRCPIFNCRKTEDGWSLLEPEEYRNDWAVEFHNYLYNNGEYPILCL